MVAAVAGAAITANAVVAVTIVRSTCFIPTFPRAVMSASLGEPSDVHIGDHPGLSPEGSLVGVTTQASGRRTFADMPFSRPGLIRLWAGAYGGFALVCLALGGTFAGLSGAEMLAISRRNGASDLGCC